MGRTSWRQWWGDLPVFDDSADQIMDFLIAEGFFDRDGDFLHIGPEAERRFGRRYFSDLTAVFSAPPEFTVLAGRNEVGTIGTDLLVEEVAGPRVLLLGGRSWTVTHVDWQRHRCFVEVAKDGGKAKWSGSGRGVSYEVTRGMREVLLGLNPEGVTLTRRAERVLADLRETFSTTIDATRLVVSLPPQGSGRWWTWAGTAANRTLLASLPTVVDPKQRIDEQSLRLLPGVSRDDFRHALTSVKWTTPHVTPNALSGLKFSSALPQSLAIETLGERLGDLTCADDTAKHLVVFNIPR